MIKKTKKLALSRETIRTLQDSELTEMVGASAACSDTCGTHCKTQ